MALRNSSRADVKASPLLLPPAQRGPHRAPPSSPAVPVPAGRIRVLREPQAAHAMWELSLRPAQMSPAAPWLPAQDFLVPTSPLPGMGRCRQGPVCQLLAHEREGLGRVPGRGERDDAGCQRDSGVVAPGWLPRPSPRALLLPKAGWTRSGDRSRQRGGQAGLRTGYIRGPKIPTGMAVAQQTGGAPLTAPAPGPPPAAAKEVAGAGRCQDRSVLL